MDLSCLTQRHGERIKGCLSQRRKGAKGGCWNYFCHPRADGDPYDIHGTGCGLKYMALGTDETAVGTGKTVAGTS
ncbi:MAG TPA: hypothetical protein PK514_14185 [Spirochaetota bacterium]|mgnify:CR=1 FL=1|nr:hypothetical protein [Spirochaetota bacterium]